MDNSAIANLAKCPSDLPDDLCGLVAEFGRLWADSVHRPRISHDVLKHWNSLLDEWSQEQDLPLFVRKSSSIRGSEIEHTETRRKIVFCDNSPAQWSFIMASRGDCPKLNDIASMIEADKIPVVMIQKTSDRPLAKYNCSLSAEFNVNKHGWKLAHIDPVGLKVRTPVTQIRIETIVERFKSLLSPANMFVVPLAWAGLAEAQEVIDAVVNADCKV